MSAQVGSKDRLPIFWATRVKSLTTSRSTWVPLLVYVLARMVDVVIIEWAVRYQAGPAAFDGVEVDVYFQYEAQSSQLGLLDVATNWDGEYYHLIANDGYGTSGPYRGDDGAYVARRSYLFPPGYPLTVRAVMDLFHLDFRVAAVAVSLACGAIAMLLIYRLARSHVGDLGAGCLVALSSTWISAPIFHTAHSEGLAMMLLAGALLALDRRRPWTASLLVLPLALTRLVTPPLALVALALYWSVWCRDRRSLSRSETVGAAVFIGVSLLSVFAWTGIQALMGTDVTADRVASYDRMYSGGWVQGLAEVNPALGLLPLLVLGAIARVAWLRRGWWGVTMSAWAVAYPTYIVAATLMVLGIIRYSLLAFPLALVLVLAPSYPRRTRLLAAAVGCAMGVLLQVLWVRYGLIVHGGRGPQIGL